MLYFHSIGRLGRICQRSRGGAAFFAGGRGPLALSQGVEGLPDSRWSLHKPASPVQAGAGGPFGGWRRSSQSLLAPLPKGPICRAVAAPLPPFPALCGKETQPARRSRWGSPLPPAERGKPSICQQAAVPFPSLVRSSPLCRGKRGSARRYKAAMPFQPFPLPLRREGKTAQSTTAAAFIFFFDPCGEERTPYLSAGSAFALFARVEGTIFRCKERNSLFALSLHTKKRNHLPVNKRPPSQPDFIPMWRNRRIFSGAEGNPLPTAPRIKRGKQSASGQHLPL